MMRPLVLVAGSALATAACTAHRVAPKPVVLIVKPPEVHLCFTTHCRAPGWNQSA